MSEEREPRPSGLTPTRVLGWARRGTLLVAAVGLAYLWSRFESFRLPLERCSPVQRVSPGTRLWVDTRPASYDPGDLVFFTGPGGEVWIGELARTRGDEVWISTDVPECPGANSDTLGWISSDRLAGRVVLATRW